MIVLTPCSVRGTRSIGRITYKRIAVNSGDDRPEPPTAPATQYQVTMTLPPAVIPGGTPDKSARSGLVLA